MDFDVRDIVLIITKPKKWNEKEQVPETYDLSLDAGTGATAIVCMSDKIFGMQFGVPVGQEDMTEKMALPAVDALKEALGEALKQMSEVAKHEEAPVPELRG